ncbi:DUF5050 domain-containing protein [Aquibacillus salsiterrae]|uniref:DUF5050 domain-containing protein n=1 Tax=Aquibacillus salsiterrae TaxID=2950439 RepID=A0A9X3WJ36_9BACI|nr:DUF5050 domain-containing protein [Aquibacillus salsiterrae]MDC3418364.1 DUF5050 domain-containing protein [Aquibacillus salsiterrae]
MQIRGYHLVQPGESLTTIANTYGVPVEQLIKINRMENRPPVIGQQLIVPIASDLRQLEYKPVTAYTVDRPILVNGEDINTGLYPVLNFKPENAQYPYVYVPIAEFRRVGATVRWNDQQQLLTVESNYQELQSEVQQLQAENERLKELITINQPIVSRGNSSGNIANWGIAALQGDWVYFSNISQGYKLYKMRLDGTGKQLLASDRSLYINVVGDWIYYINQSDQAKMYKVRTDGTQKTRIDDQHSATVISVVGDWIYYVTQSEQYKLFKIKTDGTGKTQLGNDALVEEMYATEDWIFYTLQNQNLKIFKIKPDGTQRIQVTEYGARQLIIEGDWLYFVNQTMPGIWRVKWDGTDPTSFEAEYSNPNSLNVDNNMIYYGYSDLYKTPTDSPEQIKLTPVYGYGGLINIVGDWLYFRINYNGEKLYRMRVDGTAGEFVY